MKLQNLYILVKDTDRAIKFYTDILGLVLYRRQDRYSIIKIEDTYLGLLNEKYLDEKIVYGNNCIPVFKVDNIEEEFTKLKDLNITFITEIITLTDVRLFQFYDTEGNILEIYQEL